MLDSTPLPHRNILFHTDAEAAGCRKVIKLEVMETEYAKAKYGENAKQGMILITTKKKN